jgi:hypothetical protein
MDGSSEAEMINAEGAWVDLVVAATAPVSESTLAALDLTQGFADLLVNLLGSEVPAEIVPLRRRRTSRRAGTVAIVAVIVAGGGAAAAVRGGALTGLFGAPGKTENDRSEYVNVAASNFPALAHQLGNQLHSEGLRFAPGIDPDQMVDLFVKETQRQVRLDERGNSASARITREQGEFMDVTGVKGRIASLAQCSWQESWLQAYKTGDTAGRNAAINGLTALNGVQTTTRSKNGTFRGSIMAETNQKKALNGYVGRMKDDDFGFIQRVTTLNCPTGT